MESNKLAEAVDLCKNIVGESKLYLKANKNILTVASVSSAGTTIICKFPIEYDLPALSVDLAVFGSFLKSNKQISFKAENQNLSIIAKGLKGSIPYNDVDDFPKMPILQNTNCVKSSDIDWLTAIIPLTVIKALSKTGVFSAICQNQRWSLACSDNIHGAFAFGDGSSKIAFSLAPSDVLHLNNLIKNYKDINLEVQKNRLILQTTNKKITLCLPLIEGETQTKETVTKDSRLVGKINLLQFKDAVKIITPIANSKNNSITKLIFKESGLIVSATSGSGSLSKLVESKNKENISLQLSFELLNNIVAQMTGTTASLFVFGDKEISKISFKASDVYYLMLTSE